MECVTQAEIQQVVDSSIDLAQASGFELFVVALMAFMIGRFYEAVFVKPDNQQSSSEPL